MSSCGLDKEASTKDKKIENISTEIDKSAFKKEAFLTVEGYEVDSSARIYVLNECAKIVKKGESTPPHCLNAAEAEANALFLDIKKNTESNVAEPINEQGLKQLKDEIVMAYTFKKL